MNVGINEFYKSQGFFWSLRFTVFDTITTEFLAGPYCSNCKMDSPFPAEASEIVENSDCIKRNTFKQTWTGIINCGKWQPKKNWKIYKKILNN